MESAEKIEILLQPLLKPTQFLVDVKIKPTNNYKVYVDDDNGFSIEDAIALNRALRKRMEDADWHPDGDFSLEVSSPGVGEPLRLTRQYLKNKGRNVQVTKTDGSTIEGTLAEADEKHLVLLQTTGKGKKAETRHVEVPLQEIKQTIVQIKF